MKEATGELNMTVITIVAIAAVAAIFTAFVLPSIKSSIARRTCEADYGEGNCVKQGDNWVGNGQQ